MRVSESLSRLGFDVPRLGFALRTALAAFIGLGIAWMFGLEHPQWAGMTVWAASQPVRGQLLEKGGFRLAGTVVGTLFGVALVALSGGAPAILVGGLALWIGLCAAAGNVVRGFLSYGTMLAGYSASMVALLDAAHPEHVFALGLDRFLTVAIGVVVALAIGWIFASHAPEGSLSMQVRRLTARMLRNAAHAIGQGQGDGEAEQRAILSELAVIDDMLEPHAAGSLRLRRSARAIRTLISAHVSAILWLRGAGMARDIGLTTALGRVADALDAHEPGAVLDIALDDAVSAARAHPEGAVIVELMHAIRGWVSDPVSDGSTVAIAQALPVLHRDWVGAFEAGVRACGTMLAVGIVWLLTGWSIGPFMMLGVSVMASLFSTADNPVHIVRFVLFGQIFGAVGAIALRWLAWPHAGSEVELVLMMLPFMLIGPFIQSHRNSAPMGFDYNMVLLLLSHPAWPLAGSFGNSLAMAGAIASGPIIAIVAYRLVFPTDIRRRRKTLIAMMIRELEVMAGSSNVAEHRSVWEARLKHRVLRLVRWTDRIGQNGRSAAEDGLSVLTVGNAILHVDELLRDHLLDPRAARMLKAMQRRLKSLHRLPERAARVLEIAAVRLSSEPAVRPQVLQAAARSLTANAGFFAGRGNQAV
jgi:uncharacterized membrane protein YccC